MMEKNGNTWAPGDSAIIRSQNTKLASESKVTIESVDPDTERATVKLANGATQHVNISELERG